MIRLELTREELEALINLMHAGVQSVGLKSVKDAAVLLVKIEQAVSGGDGADGEQ